jgi:hypothetical protein
MPGIRRAHSRQSFTDCEPLLIDSVRGEIERDVDLAPDNLQRRHSDRPEYWSAGFERGIGDTV